MNFRIRDNKLSVIRIGNFNISGLEVLEVGVKMLLSQISYWNDAPLWDPKSIENVTKTWFDYLGSKITREETSTL